MGADPSGQPSRAVFGMLSVSVRVSVGRLLFAAYSALCYFNFFVTLCP